MYPGIFTGFSVFSVQFLVGSVLVTMCAAWYNIASKNTGAGEISAPERWEKDMKVADIHAHAFPEKLADKAPASIGAFYGGAQMACHPASAENLAGHEREAGITRFVMSNSATTAHQVRSINDFLSQAVKGIPGAIAFGSIFPGMEGAEEELERAKALGIRGLKVHPDFQKIPIDEPCGVPVYKKAASLGLPVLFHMGDDRYDYSSPERLMNLLRQVPDLQVIAAHFGGWMAWAHSYECPLPEGVLYDTSSTLPMIPRDMVLRMLDKFGPERFLFGTDFPMWSPKEELERFLSLGFGEAVNEKILYGNFMKLFDLHDEENQTEGA